MSLIHITRDILWISHNTIITWLIKQQSSYIYVRYWKVAQNTKKTKHKHKKTKFGGKHKTLAPVATEMILSHNNGGQMT